MPKTRILLSLVTSDNDYQKQQAAVAQECAQRLDFDLEVVYAEGDPVNQSQQVLRAIQSKDKPDGIAVQPLSGTGLGQAAKAAVAAGVGWALMNRKVDYIAALKASCSVPVLQVTTDQVEIGRIQGRQVAALVPDGGTILYIQGPPASAADDRTVGFSETKPENIQVRALRGNWTQESAHAAVSAWLRLSISHTTPVRAVIAHNDAMAMGVRRAFEDETGGQERARWLELPFLGVDGLPNTGQAWVRSKLLRATVVNPATSGRTLEMLVNGLRSHRQPEQTTVVLPTSYPPVEQLGPGM